MDKAPDAFRTISEVAEDLDLPQHVLRFWETRFPQIKPLKRGGGRRYYRPDDVLLLKGIRHLLYGEGYTIKGVQRIIKEQGAKHVMVLWQDGHDNTDDALTASYSAASPTHEAYAPPLHREQLPFWEEDEDSVAHVFADDENGDEDIDLPEDRDDDVLLIQRKAHIQPIHPSQHIPAPSLPPSATPMPLAEQHQVQHKALSPDNNRKLQATLYELMECKRILEGAR